MTEKEPFKVITDQIKEIIEFGNESVARLKTINVDGVNKLANKFKQELNFLNKALASGKIKQEHCNCTNLNHLQAVASTVFEHQNNLTSIMNNKNYTTISGVTRRICIDLVLNGGSTWMKVIARNAKALSILSTGEGSYGQKSILDQAEEFLECSNQNLHYFKRVEIVFLFVNGINDELKIELENIGVKVKTVREESVFSYENRNLRSTENKSRMVKCPLFHYELEQNVKLLNKNEKIKLNLCVTTMIAYVSALTNGGCNFTFKSSILNDHAAWERARPVKPVLEQIFKDNELYACKSAVSDFKKILTTLGGEGELKRGDSLLKRLVIVDDVPTTRLKNGNKMKYRSLAIFGTGQHLKAVTVTANHAFVRSSMNQGVYFAVYLHESRALTEGKQP